MYFKFFENEDYDEKNRDLHKKIDGKEPLTAEESAFVCQSLSFENLLLYPFCLEEYFTRVFLAKTSEDTSDFVGLRVKDHIYYEGILKEWRNLINTIHHDDELLLYSSRETRKELRNLRKGYSMLQPGSSTRDYVQKRRFIFEWSKYRYIMTKNIFKFIIKGQEYKLFLNGQEIIFDTFSLMHIFAGHYAEITKPYATDKSYFTPDFHYEEIHINLEKIFKLIDNSGLYKKASIEEINLRFKGIPYKIYTKLENKGQRKYLRLNTFFPIEDKRMLFRLQNLFDEKSVSDNLSVFTTIGC